jgi:hypothetical protein
MEMVNGAVSAKSPRLPGSSPGLASGYDRHPSLGGEADAQG